MDVTPGYLNTAIELERSEMVRLALSCVYRNIRYREMAAQLSELDDDIRQFEVEKAGIDVMLAALTATATVKSKLPSRADLYKRVQAELKKRGQLETGLLDGLK